jgi:hypothetical protein
MTQIAPGLQGQVTKDYFDASMPAIAPLYPGFGQGGWHFDDIDLLMIDNITDAEAAAVLPAEASLIAIPNAPGQSAVKFAWAHYRRCTRRLYREVFQAIPCLYDNSLYLYDAVALASAVVSSVYVSRMSPSPLVLTRMSRSASNV